MPLLNYKKEFAPLVKSGEKPHTIRAFRKRPFKTGDRLYHYVGLRTKSCRKLLESNCISADTIFIDIDGTVRIYPTDGGSIKILDDLKQISALARADGFRGKNVLEIFTRFVSFFDKTHGLPFIGQLIKWG